MKGLAAYFFHFGQVMCNSYWWELDSVVISAAFYFLLLKTISHTVPYVLDKFFPRFTHAWKIQYSLQDVINWVLIHILVII